MENEIKKLDISKLYNLIRNAYNSITVIDKFCSEFNENEENSNIIPIIKMIHKELDFSYSMLIDYIN